MSNLREAAEAVIRHYDAGAIDGKPIGEGVGR